MAANRIWSHKILVLTDVHLTGDGSKIIGLDPLERFNQLFQQALDRHHDADAILLMGDLAHHGHPAAYKQLAEITHNLEIPVVPMLGNHDNRDNFLATYPDAPKDENSFVQMTLDFPDWRIIAADTLAGPPYVEGHHSGELCAKRLGWLRERLNEASDRRVLVCTHHPPFKVGIAGMDLIPLENGDQVLSVLQSHRQVQLLAGHIHRSISGVTDGIPWAMFKSPCHQGPLDLDNPDTTLSLDEPGGYGVVLLTDRGAIVHFEDLSVHGSQIVSDYRR